MAFPYKELYKEQFYYPYYSALNTNEIKYIAFKGKYKIIYAYVSTDIINSVLEKENPSQDDMIKLLNEIKFPNQKYN